MQALKNWEMLISSLWVSDMHQMDTLLQYIVTLNICFIDLKHLKIVDSEAERMLYLLLMEIML